MNRILPLFLLLVAASVLGWIAWRSGSPTERPVYGAGEDGTPIVPVAIVGEIPEGDVVRELAVDGMCCNGCSNKLYTALLALPGVERAAVDFDSSRAYAVVPVSMDPAGLSRALTFDKYTASLVH